MILNRRAESAILVTSSALLAALYAAAWLAPSVAANHESGVNLVLAKALAAGHGYVLENLPAPVPETRVPPVFPAALALFALVSSHAQWLKLLPLGCALGWFFLMRRLLLRMGASRGSSYLLVGLTAASPAVIFLSTSLVPVSLFALLTTAALLELLDDRPVSAGLLAGLATLTLTMGAALIAACILTLAARRRFRSAVIFAALAMLIVAPWLGWSLAHLTRSAQPSAMLNAPDRVATDILTGFPFGLALNEKLVVVTRNLVSLFDSPVELLTGLNSLYAAIGTALLALWCWIMRRQLVPDLFVVFYGLGLLLVIGPPQQMMAAVLPLILWIAWRALREIRRREAVAGLVIITVGMVLWADAIRVPSVFRSGVFPQGEQAANDWGQMRALFAAVNAKTSPGSVLLANDDGALFVNTQRKTVRGFTPNGYDLFYSQRQSTVTPDQLSSAIQQAQVNYVVLTPDRGAPESPSFHKAVDALERGGVLMPVELAGVSPEYRLLHVSSAGF